MNNASKTSRLPAELRRQKIIKAALGVFSRDGFHGTTTRALAKEAGVSEALLFRHFPSKEDLYGAMQQACCEMKDPKERAGICSLEPSTSSLILLVHYMMAKMLRPPNGVGDEENSLHRLMVHSFMEDGEFARGFMAHVREDFIAKIEGCIAAATKTGDLVPGPIRRDLGAWLAQHLAAMLMLNQLPGKPVVDFAANHQEMVEQATWFALRGLGVKDDAIRRLYNPKALALFLG